MTVVVNRCSKAVGVERASYYIRNYMSQNIMSEEENNVSKWLKKHHPLEYDLSNDIAKRTDEILKHVRPLEENAQVLPIRFGVLKAEGRSGLSLVLNEYGLIFIGAMARAILESLSGQLEGLLQSGAADTLIKQKINQVFSDMVKFSTMQQAPDGQTWLECHNCHKSTPANGRYCTQCGVTIK